MMTGRLCETMKDHHLRMGELKGRLKKTVEVIKGHMDMMRQELKDVVLKQDTIYE